MAQHGEDPRARPCPPTTRPRWPRSSPELKKVIYGQDEAIDAIASAIKLSRSGLRRAREAHRHLPLLRPHRAWARPSSPSSWRRILGVEFLRFDMTEYQEKHTVSRLIGAPPGYVGFDQGGLLTDAIRKHPLRGAAARRDREGPPGHLQHPAPGDGPRHPHRQRRAQGRLPPHRAHHDHQRRRPRALAAGRWASGRSRARRATRATPSSAPSAPSSATGSTPGSPSSRCRPRSSPRSWTRWWPSWPSSSRPRRSRWS